MINDKRILVGTASLYDVVTLRIEVRINHAVNMFRVISRKAICKKLYFVITAGDTFHRFNSMIFGKNEYNVKQVSLNDENIR